jgi:hypothetical protein
MPRSNFARQEASHMESRDAQLAAHQTVRRQLHPRNRDCLRGACRRSRSFCFRTPPATSLGLEPGFRPRATVRTWARWSVAPARPLTDLACRSGHI